MFVIKLRKTFLFFNVKSSCDHGYLLSKDELKISNRLYKIFNLITVLPKVEYPLEEKTQKKKKKTTETMNSVKHSRSFAQFCSFIARTFVFFGFLVWIALYFEIHFGYISLLLSTDYVFPINFINLR